MPKLGLRPTSRTWTVKTISSGSNELPFGVSRRMAGTTAACTRAGTVKFTSRILEGLVARRGLVELREGIGCWVSGYWPGLTLGGPF